MFCSSGVVAASYSGVTEPPAGMLQWHRADQGITLVSGGVSSWADLVGSQTMTQSTSGARPTRNDTWKNGKPGIVFDGVNDILSRSTSYYPAGQGLTVFVVGKSDIDNDTVDAGNNLKAWFGIQSLTGNDCLFISRFNGTSSRFVANTAGGSSPTISGTFGTGTLPSYQCWATEGSAGSANLIYRANGVAKTTSGALADTSNVSFMTFIGGFSGNYLAATIGEVLIYPYLTGPQILAVESYITSYWGAF
jgi:hypothetical protein